jgi:hypothetical protein
MLLKALIVIPPVFHSAKTARYDGNKLFEIWVEDNVILVLIVLTWNMKKSNKEVLKRVSVYIDHFLYVQLLNASVKNHIKSFIH